MTKEINMLFENKNNEYIPLPYGVEILEMTTRLSKRWEHRKNFIFLKI